MPLDHQAGKANVLITIITTLHIHSPESYCYYHILGCIKLRIDRKIDPCMYISFSHLHKYPNKECLHHFPCFYRMFGFLEYLGCIRSCLTKNHSKKTEKLKIYILDKTNKFFTDDV